MKRVDAVLAFGLSVIGAAALTGCDRLDGVPYNSQAPAAKIYESQQSATGAPPATASLPSGISIPVEVADPEAARYLTFSPVEVEVKQKDNDRLVTVVSRIRIPRRVWRVGLMKDGNEFHHFITSSKGHGLDEVIPLEPLALDSNLSVPDKIVVSLVSEAGE